MSVVLAVLAIVVPAQAEPPAPAPWEARGCEHGHSYRAAERGVRTALRHHRPMSAKRGARAWHFVRCTTRRGDTARLEGVRDRWRLWRALPAHRWPIRFHSLPAGWQAWARATSSCETGGTLSPTIHNPSGIYHGAFQFLLGTWRSAGGAGDPHTKLWAEQAWRSVYLARTDGTHHWPVCGR